jgi:hypothetical protein
MFSICRSSSAIPPIWTVIDGPIGQELLDKVSNNPNTRLIGLAWMDAGARSLYDTKRPIKSIDDLKGLKVRVVGNPMFVDMMNALGGNGVAMGYDRSCSPALRLACRSPTRWDWERWPAPIGSGYRSRR